MSKDDAINQDPGNQDPGNQDPSGVITVDGAPLAYDDAVTELESILGRLEASTVDVDHLAEQVARATALIAHCRIRLDTVRTSVADVLDDAAGLGTDDAAEPGGDG